MPDKVPDTRTSDPLHAVEAETALAAQRIVATYSEDFLDAVTLMSMLGVEPEGLIHRKVLRDIEAEAAKARKTTKKAAKKAAKKTAKKAAKKTAKKATKKAAKKTTKKAAAKKTTKKAAKKATKAASSDGED